MSALVNTGLGLVEVRVHTALADQLVVGTALGDDAIGDGNDPACGPDGAEPVGDDQRGSAHGKGVEGSLDLGLRHGVQGGSSFVQNENRRILQEDPGNGHTLYKKLF